MLAGICLSPWETHERSDVAKEYLGEVVQFERQGYFCLDPVSKPERLVFIRTIGLRDTWAKDQAKDQAKEKAPG